MHQHRDRACEHDQAHRLSLGAARGLRGHARDHLFPAGASRVHTGHVVHCRLGAPAPHLSPAGDLAADGLHDRARSLPRRAQCVPARHVAVHGAGLDAVDVLDADLLSGAPGHGSARRVLLPDRAESHLSPGADLSGVDAALHGSVPLVLDRQVLALRVPDLPHRPHLLSVHQGPLCGRGVTMADVAILAQGLNKKYKVYNAAMDRLKEAFYRGRRRFHREVWALRDINIEVPKGTALGVVGSNGAGKSTLLKILAGTTTPSSGVFET